jgi:hypothetical protein
MTNIRSLAIGVAMALVSSSVAAQVDCAALANSAGAEPAGYAAQCMPGVVAAPQSFVNPRAPTDTAFTIDIRGQAPRPANTLYSFILNAFSTQTTIGLTNPQVFAMDFNAAATTLFGVTGSAAAPNPSTLGTISTTTGAFTPIAAVTGLTAGDGASGLTIHPVTGAAFLSAAGGTPLSSRLYSLNLTTGAATLIGPMTGPPADNIVIDISMNCSGRMIAHEIATDSFYDVNTATGAMTLIGPHGLAANFAQGMDFDNQDGTLYAFIYTGAGTNRFGSVNLTTGAFTTLVQDNPLGEFEGAVRNTCTAGATAPVFGFTPAPGATVSATGGTTVGSTGNLSIAPAIATAGTGTGTPATTTLTCTAPTAPFAGFGQTVTAIGTGAITGGPLAGTCTLGAAAATQTLTCVENRGGTPTTRTWTLSCPAGTAPPAPTVAVNATSAWSLIALMLGLFGFAAVMVRRQG